MIQWSKRHVIPLQALLVRQWNNVYDAADYGSFSYGKTLAVMFPSTYMYALNCSLDGAHCTAYIMKSFFGFVDGIQASVNFATI